MSKETATNAHVFVTWLAVTLQTNADVALVNRNCKSVPNVISLTNRHPWTAPLPNSDLPTM
jgi:hypothetical protein